MSFKLFCRGSLGVIACAPPGGSRPAAAPTCCSLGILLFCLLSATSAKASSVLTSNSETAFLNAVAEGGVVTLNLTGSISLTQPVTVAKDVTLDATGHAVAISGGNAR